MSTNITFAECEIVHLTLCGVEAGRPLCDCKRSEEKNACFLHAVYAPPIVMASPKLCARCKAEWDAAV